MSKRDRKGKYVLFESDHPLHESRVQFLARDESQLQTETFSGSITENQLAEDQVPGGNPLTMSAENEVCEVLLGLFNCPVGASSDEHTAYF